MKKTLIAVIVAVFMLTLVAACADATPAPPATGTTPDVVADNVSSSPEPAPTDNTPPPTENTPEPAEDFDASRRISVFTREDGSGTRDAFVSITGVGDDMYLEAAVLTATAQIRSSVQENLFGIGYVSLGSLRDYVKALDIDGITPSAETIINGSYSIQRPFLIVTNDEKDTDELVQDFIKFVLSAQGQEIAADGWVSPVASPADYTPGGLSGTLRIGGSTSVDPLMQSLRTAYIEINPNVRIEISGGGSGTGISEATGGVIDIGMSSRNLREAEKEALNEYVIALDGVVVIVNNDNPISNMEMETVKEIFTGEKTNWNQIN